MHFIMSAMWEFLFLRAPQLRNWELSYFNNTVFLEWPPFMKVSTFRTVDISYDDNDRQDEHEERKDWSHFNELLRPEARLQGYMKQCYISWIAATWRGGKQHLTEIYIRAIKQLISSGRKRDKGLLSFMFSSGAWFDCTETNRKHLCLKDLVQVIK